MSDRPPSSAIDAPIHVNRLAAVAEVLPSVAHDLNNCLQIIGGLAEMLARQPDSSASVGAKADRIRDQAQRATTLVRDVVAFSRRDDVRQSRVDVRRAVERALAFRRYALSRGGVVVELDLPADAVLVDADSQWLDQILVNLILEAERALSAAEPRRLAVSVRCAGARSSVQIQYGGALPLSNAAEERDLADPRADGVGPAVAALMAARLGGGLTFAADGGRTVARLDLPASAGRGIGQGPDAPLSRG